MNRLAGGPAIRQLDSVRWHFQHGPIDLILLVEGNEDSCKAAIRDAWTMFEPLLGELAAQLATLQSPAPVTGAPKGNTARLMCDAVLPFAQVHGKFVTPMAAVAGAVAQTLIECFKRSGIERAAINNGGDIAIHLAPGQQFNIGMVHRVATAELDGAFVIRAVEPVRGVATSGWGGRSLSLGIADSVTVLAASASQADAAATMIANEVNVEHPCIMRKPADQVRDNSDLGTRLVTVGVGPLPEGLVKQALERGRSFAQRLQLDGLIHHAALSCQQQWMVLS